MIYLTKEMKKNIMVLSYLNCVKQEKLFHDRFISGVKMQSLSSFFVQLIILIRFILYLNVDYNHS